MISSLKSTFDIVNRRALYISPARVTIYHWSRGQLDTSYSFDHGDEGYVNFETYLSAMPGDVIYVLLDIPEEEFRLDSIPHVMGGDRRALLRRKRERHFRNSDYTYTEVQGRDSDGRRDDRVLFSCLMNKDLFEPWLTLLRKHKVPVAGVYSVALMSKYLLPHVGKEAGGSLIVSLQRHSGLRQTFYKDGEFKFSRLVKAPRYGTVPYAPFIHDEIQKMLRYLRSMRLVNVEQATNIYLLGDDALLGDLREVSEDGTNIHHQFVSLDNLASRFEIQTGFTEPFAEPIFAWLLLNNCPRNLYATDTDTSYYQIRRMRNAMLAASLVMIVGSMIWSSITFVDALSLKQQALSAEAKADFYYERYRMASERLPETPVEARQLKTVVEAVRDLYSYRTSPLDMMRTVSTGLAEYPDIQISEIDWFATMNPEATARETAPRGRGRRRGGVEVEPVERDHHYYQVAEIKGYLAPFDGNYRHAIARVNEFAENLRAMEQVYDVNIKSLPLDVSEEARLHGTAERPSTDANFVIRVVVGIEHEV